MHDDYIYNKFNIETFFNLKLKYCNFSPLFLAMLPYWWEEAKAWHELPTKVTVEDESYSFWGHSVFDSAFAVREDKKTPYPQKSFFEIRHKDNLLRVVYKSPEKLSFYFCDDKDSIYYFSIKKKYHKGEFFGYACEVKNSHLATTREIEIHEALHDWTTVFLYASS